MNQGGLLPIVKRGLRTCPHIKLKITEMHIKQKKLVTYSKSVIQLYTSTIYINHNTNIYNSSFILDHSFQFYVVHCEKSTDLLVYETLIV